MKQKICGAIATLAFIWLLSIAGASDLGQNTVRDILTQGGAALAIFAGSLYLGGFLGTVRGGSDEDRNQRR